MCDCVVWFEYVKVCSEGKRLLGLCDGMVVREKMIYFLGWKNELWVGSRVRVMVVLCGLGECGGKVDVADVEKFGKYCVCAWGGVCICVGGKKSEKHITYIKTSQQSEVVIVTAGATN